MSFLSLTSMLSVKVSSRNAFIWSIFQKALSYSLHHEKLPVQIYWKFYHQKMKIFRLKKNLICFPASAQNIDCGYSLEPPRRGGSNEYPQSMFWADIWKIMYTPVNPSFTI